MASSPYCGSRSRPRGVRVVEADALAVDWSQLLAPDGPGDGPWTLVANLPYNVAVPLVIGVLEDAPQVSTLLVMVQREVGERMAATVGDKAYGAVSVKVAYWATASVVGRVPAAVFIPRPRVESVLVRLDRRTDDGGKVSRGRGRPVTSEFSPWCGPGSPTDARCSGGSLEGHVRPGGLRRRRHRAHGPGRRARSGPVGAAGRLATASGSGPTTDGSLTVTAPFPGPANLSAPAKLTLSLRITGTRGDGFHLLESEMVTVDLMDTLQVEEGDGLTVAIDPGRRRLASDADLGGTRQPGGEGPGRGRAHGPGPRGQEDSPGAGLGGGSADAAAILRWAGCAEGDLAVGLGADVPFCLVGGRALVRGVGEEVEALPYDRPPVHAVAGALRRGDGRRLPGLGRADVQAGEGLRSV